MNPEECEFIAENEQIQILPNFNESTMQLICGAIENNEQFQDHLKPEFPPMAPEWLSVDEIKRLIVAENERTNFAPIPSCFFEIAHIVLINAKEDVDQIEQVKTLVKDLWDKREAKMRTSTIRFLSQYESAYAQLDNLTRFEVSYARPAITEATKAIEKLNGNLHSIRD